MRIIKLAESTNIKEATKKCYKCKCKFAYNPSDINNDRDGRYVICPSCSSFIAI